MYERERERESGSESEEAKMDAGMEDAKGDRKKHTKTSVSYLLFAFYDSSYPSIPVRLSFPNPPTHPLSSSFRLLNARCAPAGFVSP